MATVDGDTLEAAVDRTTRHFEPTDVPPRRVTTHGRCNPSQI